MAYAWPAVFVAVVYSAIGRLGFFPTDEGLIQGWTYRILHGQVPHRDFAAPMPEGSGFLHLVDFAIPAPLFEVSRVIALCEYVAYAVLFAWLIYGLAPRRWSIAMASGAAFSVFVNMNVFPLMAWYTVDGLLLVAAGMVMVSAGVRRGSRGVILLGFLVVGTAAVTKQSFVPAPAIAWLLLVPRLRVLESRQRVAELVATGAIASLPSLFFVGTISAFGGLRALRGQLLGTAFVYGRPLASQWSPHRDLLWLVLLVGATALLAAIIGSRRVTHNVELGSRMLVSALVLGIPVAAQLGISGNTWADRLFWMAVAFWSVRAVALRAWDGVGAAVIGCAWMSALSYGFPYPSFVAGTTALYMLHRTWSATQMPEVRIARALPAAAGIAVFGLMASVFLNTRLTDVYLDRPAGELTATLDGVSGSFGSIRTNPNTADYLSQMKACIQRYPAKYVAILPENAAMYPALGLSNPFPIDWMWPDAMHGAESAILATVPRLNSSGDYLVLFQTVDEPQVVGGSLVPAQQDSPIASYTPIVAQIYAGLGGQRSTCGTFLVVYSPPPGS